MTTDNDVPKDGTSDSPLDKWKGEIYTHFTQRRSKLTEFLFETVKQTDQALLVISGVALSFSTSLAKWMISNPPLLLEYLAISWGSFCLTIILTLISLFASRKTIQGKIIEEDEAYAKIIKEIDGEETAKGDNFSSKYVKRWGKITTSCNVIAALSFCVAWFCLFFFAIHNLDARISMGNNLDQSIGFADRKPTPTPPPPPPSPKPGEKRIDEGFIPPYPPPPPPKPKQ